MSTALLDRIDRIQTAIDGSRLLSEEEISGLDRYFRVELTYTSNALEGNALDITQTKVLLEDGLVPGGKTLKDCNEAAGHARAYDFMLQAARNPEHVISEDTILNLHRLFYSGIDPDNAGRYRSRQVFIRNIFRRRRMMFRR